MAVTLLGEFALLFQMACVIFLVAYLFAKSGLFTQVLEHRTTLSTQIFLALVFGLLSVYGMSSGITFYTATVNIRDFGPLAAGLSCGPWIGLGAGIVGLIYRLAVGGTNVYAVAIGPLATGVAGGLVWYFRGKELVRVRTAALVAFCAESLVSAFAIIVRILGGENPATWMTVTINVAVPMILMTTLAVAVFTFILQNEKRDRRVRDEKNQLEREVESKRNLAAIVNTIAYPVYVLDRNHRFTMVNESLSRFLGKPPEEILARTPADFFVPEDAALHWELTEDVFKKTPFRTDEVTVTRLDGRKRTIIATSRLYTDPAGVCFMVGGIHDITQRKKMELELAESAAWYRTLFEHTGTATVIIEEDGTISQVNSEFAALTGFSRQETEGKLTIKQIIHEDDFGRIWNFHLDRLRDPASVPTHYTVRIRDRSGVEKTLHAMVAVIPGTTKSIGSYADISDQKRTEESLTLVNRKLNLLSSITRHDIINQILVLKGFLSLARKRTTDPALIDFIGKSERAAGNIEHQITFTRDYQDMGVRAPAWQNVRDLVIAAKGALPAGDVSIEAGPSDLEVYADPLFEKVFYNLIDNSLRYGGEEMRTIRISADPKENYLTLTYQDDGTGIATGDKERLFERGFGRHTGFGLFLSREILSITGITIEETGVAGPGARFTIRIPRGGYRYQSRAAGDS